jgi:SAM-dependent methyltransferase
MKPEEYWVLRGSDVIGQDVLRDGAAARQAATYQAVATWVMAYRIEDVLDVGCNVAALALFLRAAGYDGLYKGLDTNPYALRIARARGESVDDGNLRNLDFGEKAYQAVVVKDVIEHLESPEPLSEAFRVAREYVVVATYLPWTDAPAAITRHADGYYTNRYRFADVTALAARCGFDLIETQIVNEANGQPNQVTLWRRGKGL